MYASKIMFQSDLLKMKHRFKKNCNYHTILGECGKDLWSDKDYDLQGTIGDKMIKITIKIKA